MFPSRHNRRNSMKQPNTHHTRAHMFSCVRVVLFVVSELRSGREQQIPSKTPRCGAALDPAKSNRAQHTPKRGAGGESMLCGQVLGLLVPVSSTRCRASTSGLSTRSSTGSLTHSRGGRPHLKASFPLRCFQRLSLPNVANQPCTWRYNWHTRGSSVPVLSY